MLLTAAKKAIPYLNQNLKVHRMTIPKTKTEMRDVSPVRCELGVGAPTANNAMQRCFIRAWQEAHCWREHLAGTLPACRPNAESAQALQ